MNRDPLEGVKACVFDAYGTLFDFAAAARSCRDVLGEATDKLTALWRDKQRQYTWLRAAQDRHADFWQVTGDALDFAMGTLGIAKPELRERLMQLYLTLETFPEVPDVLRQLKRAGLEARLSVCHLGRRRPPVPLCRTLSSEPCLICSIRAMPSSGWSPSIGSRSC